MYNLQCQYVIMKKFKCLRKYKTQGRGSLNLKFCLIVLIRNANLTSADCCGFIDSLLAGTFKFVAFL